MMTDKKRKLYIFGISIIMNLVFFLAAYILKLPMWLDTTGTIYISLLLYFPAGFVVGLINNIILSLFFYGFNSIYYYVISAAVALITSVCVKKYGTHRVRFLFVLFCSVYITSILLLIPLTIFVDNGVPSDYWGNYWYLHFIGIGINQYISTVLVVCLIKLIDVIFAIFFVCSVYKITPLKIRKSDHVILRERRISLHENQV